jgi:hypothetical protein
MFPDDGCLADGSPGRSGVMIRAERRFVNEHDLRTIAPSLLAKLGVTLAEISVNSLRILLYGLVYRSLRR